MYDFFSFSFGNSTRAGGGMGTWVVATWPPELAIGEVGFVTTAPFPLELTRGFDC